MKFAKVLGRLLRWSAFFVLLYIILTNVHVTLELNKPRGIDDMMDKIGITGKVISFIRNF